FSIQKAASILGLGSNSVVTVPCDARYCINPDTLLSLIEKNIALDNIPMAVIATAGTTDFGSIDPILPIADICERYNIWLHVDAAYGGGLLLSKKHRLLLSGIEKADSITVDFHKSFFQPVSCSTFLLQNKTHFSNITYHADYLNPFSQYEEGTPDSINKSIQTTRRFDALKLWLTLRTQGEDSIGEMFDHVISLAHEVFLLLLADRLIDVIHTPQLSALVFRFKPLGAYSPMQLNHTNHYIRKALSRSGEALIAATKVNNEQYLKFTLLNPATTLDDIQSVIKAIKQHGLTFMQHKGW
ncbi:MAG: pyridoxal-dependent decarboxylase, partial [Endozoicomonas sp. (ex Botrylloides leachii)]|nr:pyridoxal-dependent decarboxylase [Endozoicomonas sp. (ex Botrylloides leachii)]